MELAGKTAVVTGAASGIGRELAQRFAGAGMNIVLADVEAAPLAETDAAMRSDGYQVLAHELDVRDLDQIKALEAAARERFGNVHVLCNNAGVGSGGPVADPDDLEFWRWTIDINLWGVIYGCKVFLPGMLEHGEPAHIVNTASMAGLAAAPFMGAYNVSKYGVVALSETLKQEMLLMQSEVGVSVLCPAFVATGIADSRRNLPDDLAAQLPAPDAMSEGIDGGIRAMVAAGISTELVGDAVLDAVVNDKFWILTHDEARIGVTARAEQIVNGTNPVLAAAFAQAAGFDANS